MNGIASAAPGIEHNLLRIYTGRHLSESEAGRLRSRIADHKWYVSEQLKRDVGFHVAAIDYVENFYNVERSTGTSSTKLDIVGRINRMVKAYFEAKAKSFIS